MLIWCWCGRRNDASIVRVGRMGGRIMISSEEGVEVLGGRWGNGIVGWDCRGFDGIVVLYDCGCCWAV